MKPMPGLCSVFHWLSKMTGVLEQMTCLSRFMSSVTNSMQLLSVLLPSKLYLAFIILSLTGFLSVSKSYTMSLHIIIGGAYSPHSNRFCNILKFVNSLFTQTALVLSIELWLNCNTNSNSLFSVSTHTPSLSSCHPSFPSPGPFLCVSLKIECCNVSLLTTPYIYHFEHLI